MFADARAALKSPWLYLSSAVALVVLLRPTMEWIIPAWQGLSAMDVMSYYSHVDAFTGIGRFLVLFCTLPYAASFFDECRSDYARYILLHTTPNRYIASKMLAVSLSGAVALAIPYGVISALGVLLFQPTTALNFASYYDMPFWKDFILAHGAGAALAVKVGVEALYGWVWSLTGLFFACFVNHRLSIYVLPLVIYQSTCTLMPDGLFHPVYLHNANNLRYSGLWVPLLMELGYYILFGGLCVGAMKRRLRHV